MIEKFCDWNFSKIEKYGFKKWVIMVGMVCLCFGIVRRVWVLEKNQEIVPIGNTVLLGEKEILVTQEGEVSKGISIETVISETCYGIDAELDSFITFSQLSDVCDLVIEKKEKIVIPEGAGCFEHGKIDIYAWCEKSEHFITGADLESYHLVYFNGEKYIEISAVQKLLFAKLEAKLSAGYY